MAARQDIERDINGENFADDQRRSLVPQDPGRPDLIGYSMGGGVAMQCAIRHPDKVRKVVVISSTFRRDGMVKEAIDIVAEAHGGGLRRRSPIESRVHRS